MVLTASPTSLYHCVRNLAHLLAFIPRIYLEDNLVERSFTCCVVHLSHCFSRKNISPKKISSDARNGTGQRFKDKRCSRCKSHLERNVKRLLILIIPTVTFQLARQYQFTLDIQWSNFGNILFTASLFRPEQNLSQSFSYFKKNHFNMPHS